MAPIPHNLEPRLLSAVLGALVGAATITSVAQHDHETSHHNKPIPHDHRISAPATPPNAAPSSGHSPDIGVDFVIWVLIGTILLVSAVVIAGIITSCCREMVAKKRLRDERNAASQLATFRVLGGRFENNGSNDDNDNGNGGDDLKEENGHEVGEKPPPYSSQAQELPAYTS
ncbi:hypothetical protein TWF506_010722 [Arthrobotrys conoides]|uniref:Transmembrane protein n=1 Tax=Arthrobotrys conoides TaxID=74498 RepID=A0AAN8NS32_9PEZI